MDSDKTVSIKRGLISGVYYKQNIDENMTYPLFLKSIGLSTYSVLFYKDPEKFTYQIINEKLWFLSKIKYGF